MNKKERDRFIAWVGYSNQDGVIWGQYERLFEFVFIEYSKTKRRFDEISIPTLSILSHAIELGLKENIKFLSEYIDSKELSKFDNWTQLIKSHDLESLTKEFKTAYYKLHKKVTASNQNKLEFVKYYKKFQTLINLLERYTETYRYAFKLDNDGNITKESIQHSKKIDFLEIKELFESAKIFLFGAPNSLGIYTDFIDYKRGNPEYTKGKGFLYSQKSFFTEHFLELKIENLNNYLTNIGKNKWLDSDTGENYEIRVWDNHIYVIAI